MNVEKQFDVICMGRVAVDLYSQQIGAKLEDVSGFAKYLGGSSGNVAYGTARQGLRSSMLARVGNEHMGRFVREELQRAGCDTSHLITDEQRLTALVLLGIKDKDTFPLIFYRDNCADMAISTQDFSEHYIASARCLAITGTHLSHPRTREAVLCALTYARRNNVRTVLDIDYRPVLWGLTTPGDGETRFIAAPQVTSELQAVLHLFDVIVGTEEEFHIAGGDTNTINALRQVRKVTAATLVCKRGAKGCSVYTSAAVKIPQDGINVAGVQVAVLNVLGAGDAFMSGLLRGYLNDESWEQACHYANACGALVVSRHGCAPAMPDKTELDDYLARAGSLVRPDLDPRLNHLHRIAARRRQWPELYAMAFDHRIQLEEMALQCGSDLQRIPLLKKLLLQASREAVQLAGVEDKAGILCDSAFGQDALNEITGSGWWIARPVELPGSRPLEMEHGNIGSQLTGWPSEHIVKCLVFYHPEDSHPLRLQQERKIDEIYRACCQSGHELLLEIILPASMPRNDDLYLRAVTRFYNLGIFPDWWKLPPLSKAGWAMVTDLISCRDPHCRGIVILGLDAPQEVLCEGFNAAADYPLVKGFAVGRTLFAKESRDWFNYHINDAELVVRIRDNYLRLIARWCERA